jgi:hypothetical protein
VAQLQRRLGIDGIENVLDCDHLGLVKLDLGAQFLVNSQQANGQGIARLQAHRPNGDADKRGIGLLLNNAETRVLTPAVDSQNPHGGSVAFAGMNLIRGGTLHPG